MDYKGEEIPILVNVDGRDYDLKIDRFIDIGIEKLDYPQQKKDFKPWEHIEVKDKLPTTTDIEYIKTVYLPIINGYGENVCWNYINEFIAGGKAIFEN